MTTPTSLQHAVSLDPAKILTPERLSPDRPFRSDIPILVILAAGKGTRFGAEPKCIQPVHGTPLARHSIEAFLRFSGGAVIGIVGYRHQDVAGALGPEAICVLTDNPTGGTAFAAYEALSVPGLVAADPPVIITMGDRIVPAGIFRRLWEAHQAGDREADLTFLTARYEPPKNRGKGRVLRGEDGRVLQIKEERDILADADELTRQALLNLTEGNCPLYAVRAATLHRHLGRLTNDNAQGQFYLTDIIEAIASEGGDIRTITTNVADPEYDLLTSDVTRPMDLALLEGIVASNQGLLFTEEIEVEQAAQKILAGRPPAQVAAITRQLRQLQSAAQRPELSFLPGRPIAIGISGGRLRIAFMHPDMVRFFGPAWQMPVGAGRPDGEEQIVVALQPADDQRIHLNPLERQYQESISFVPADADIMYPGDEISDLHEYEQFGTRMSENLLLSLGYFSDQELEARRSAGLPMPPPALWAGNNMRRPFALVGNAIASMRTLRTGHIGAKVRQCLGRATFRGLRILTTGNIPQGGFSSSSAVTVATKNAINALFDLGIPADVLVHLACQAEYGTGVRAGSLDQATEQNGRAGQGTLISSNPKDNYRTLGTFPVPTDRIQIIFPYTVERDRAAWQWSGGAYSQTGATAGPLTTSEARKMTGKAAEIAALLTRLPLGTDYFKPIENDLIDDGQLSLENRSWISSVLREVPLLIRQQGLSERVFSNRDWYIEQLIATNQTSEEEARHKADATMAALFTGWRDPVLRRRTSDGEIVEESGVPLRAILAYLFGEVAKNFYLLHNPESWIESVTWSQRGDRCFDIDPEALPNRTELEGHLNWERSASGPGLLERWLDRHSATPFDFNRGLDDESLSASTPPEFHRLEGSNFFRGLALIDLAEAMLKRAFGAGAVAVRVNAAGQGDYFQVHVDQRQAPVEEVKQFIAAAIYRRFGIKPATSFVELHPGGGAVGVQLSRLDALGQLIRCLEVSAGSRLGGKS